MNKTLDLQAEITRLEVENELLRQALAFYANPKYHVICKDRNSANYGWTVVGVELGHKAREALAQLEAHDERT